MVAKALGGVATGRDAVLCPGPGHSARDRSLAVKLTREGQDFLVWSYSGDDWRLCRDHVRKRLGLTALRFHAARPTRTVVMSASTKQSNDSPDDDARRTEAALRLWAAAVPAAGTLVETYLGSRGLQVPAPDTLRFHPRLKHPSGDCWPGMVALVTNGATAEPVAIHRTYLRHDGTGKAPVEPPKMMLGPTRGGAVRLAEGDAIMVGEGIETVLAAMAATGLPGWAALSTSGLRSLDLPERVHDVIVLADGDLPGEAAAKVCALRWKREGRRVRIARPPQGSDFNGMLSAPAGAETKS